MKNEMMKQFMKATMVETTLVILITALKVLNPTFAKADPPVPVAPFTRMDVNAIPEGRHRRPPMVEINAATELVISSGPRLIIGMRLHGANMDEANLPHNGLRLFQVSAEVGVGANDIGGQSVSRIKLNIVPLQIDPERSSSAALDYLNVITWNMDFERELSVGVLERFRLLLLGFQMGDNDEYSTPTAEEISGIYHLFHLSVRALGVEYQRLATFQGSQEYSDAGPSIFDTNFEVGFGSRLSQGWTIECLLQGSANVGLQYVSERSRIDPSIRVTGSRARVDTQAAVEIRLRFNDQIGYTRFQGYIRGQYRYNAVIAPTFTETNERIGPSNRSAASILAGIRVGF